MKFSNAELCTSVKNIVEGTILPALDNAESQAAAMSVVTAMEELIKRDASTQKILEELLPEGIRIAEELTDLLLELKLPDADSAKQVLTEMKRRGGESLQEQTRCYNTLMALMESACRDLLESRALHPSHKDAISSVIDKAGRWDFAYVQAQSAPLKAETTQAEAPQPLNAEKLENFLASTLPEGSNPQVSGFERVPGGMSKQTYFFSLGDEKLVVRKANNKQILDLGCLNIKREYHLLKDVHAAGFPCPKPLWFADEPADTDGSYFVMQRSPGEVLGTFFGSENALSEDLLMHLAEIFAQLHSIPMEHFAANINEYADERYIGASVEKALRYNLEGFYEFWRNLERLPSPMEIRALRWLQDNIPRNSNPVVLTHNDLLIHNFLAEDDRISAVLDWEGACFGDPAADIGYVKTEVSKHMDWNKFLDHYRTHGGQPINEDSLSYHECMTNLRNLAGTNKHTTTIKTGHGDPKDIVLTYNYVPVFMQLIDKNIA